MSRRVKKTYELDEETIDAIRSLAECFDIPEREVIEIAVLKPKMLDTASKICKLKKKIQPAEDDK